MRSIRKRLALVVMLALPAAAALAPVVVHGQTARPHADPGEHVNYCCIPAAEVLPPGCQTNCTNPPVTCNSTSLSTARKGECRKSKDVRCSDGGFVSVNTYFYSCSGPVSTDCTGTQLRCTQERIGDPLPIPVDQCTGTTCP